MLQRKAGLFKKAYELGVLCSVVAAVIIFGVFETVLCSAVFLLLIPFGRSPLAIPNRQSRLSPPFCPSPRLFLGTSVPADSMIIDPISHADDNACKDANV